MTQQINTWSLSIYLLYAAWQINVCWTKLSIGIGLAQCL